MAHIHAAAFAPERGWSEAEFHALASNPLVTVYCHASAFALVRTIADESELLTLATAPSARRQGLAMELMTRWLAETQARTAFLEVAADNAAAQRLYTQLGFAETGRRRNYYARANAPRCDAVLMQKAVTHRQDDNSALEAPKTG